MNDATECIDAQSLQVGNIIYYQKTGYAYCIIRTLGGNEGSHKPKNHKYWFRTISNKYAKNITRNTWDIEHAADTIVLPYRARNINFNNVLEVREQIAFGIKHTQLNKRIKL